jgi:hypothetical protein
MIPADLKDQVNDDSHVNHEDDDLRRTHVFGELPEFEREHRSKPVRFSMSPCESSFDSRSSLKRSPITMIVS